MRKIIIIFSLLFLAALAAISAIRLTGRQITNPFRGSAELNFIKPPDDYKIFVPILVYHHIGTAPQNLTSADKSFFIAPEWLDEHIKYLNDKGFTAIKFADIKTYLETGIPLPARPVIISFDDGRNSTYEKAFPILKKYNMTGTVFIIANSAGRGSYMSWEQLKELQNSGWEIGSHSLWHPYLTKVSMAKAKAEIEDSKKIIEEKLGVSVTTFAYPFGDYNASIETLVKSAGYSLARSFSNGSGITKDNLFHIPVIRVWANVKLKTWDKLLFPQ